MKITKENSRVFSHCDYDCSCWIQMSEAPSKGTKVVEVPKVWRENGKQYKVTTFGPEINFDNTTKIILKAPYGCEIVGLFWNKYYTVERYD